MEQVLVYYRDWNLTMEFTITVRTPHSKFAGVCFDAILFSSAFAQRNNSCSASWALAELEWIVGGVFLKEELYQLCSPWTIATVAV